MVDELFENIFDIVLSLLEICEPTLASSDLERWKIDGLMSFSLMGDFSNFLNKLR